MRRLLFSAVGGALGVLLTVAAPARAGVTVYDATQLSYDRYEVIERLWVDGWRTAFHVPQAATREAAVADLAKAAERLGADGLIGVYCPTPHRANPDADRFYCYGNAIRLKAR